MAYNLNREMIYTLFGKYLEQGENYFLVETNDIGFKVLANRRTLSNLPPPGNEVKIFCYLYVREEQFELYGFLKEEALKLFEMLNTVAGIGPKTALLILDNDSVENIMAAIIEKRTELLTRTSGIGQKTAERIILELHTKIKLPKAKALTKTMDINFEIEEALVGLGYNRNEIRRALGEISPQSKTLEDRLKETLKVLSKRR